MKYNEILKPDDLLRASSLMFFAAIIASGINLFYQIFMSRVLGVANYGVFGALFALSFYISFILVRTIRVSSTRFISEFKSKNNYKLIPIFHSKMVKRMMVAGIIGVIIFSLLSGFIAEFLHLESVYLVLPIGLIFLFSWITPINLGIIQGLQRFKHLAGANIVRASARFAMSGGLVLVGFGLYGAVGGLVLGAMITLTVSFVLLFYALKTYDLKIDIFERRPQTRDQDPEENTTNNTKPENEIVFKDVYKVSFFVMLTVACLTIPTNIDVIIVKHFFTETATGLYTAASVFGKIIFFLPIGITTVMYPKVVESHMEKKDTTHILQRSLLYAGLPGGLLVISFLLIPRVYIGILFGDEYLNADSYLILYGPLMFFFSLNTVIVYYNLAKSRYNFIYLFTALSLLEIGVLWAFHDTLLDMLKMFLIMNFVIFCVGCGFTYFTENKK